MAKKAPNTKQATFDCNTPPVIPLRLGWGEHKAKFGSQITPTAKKLIRALDIPTEFIPG